MAVVSWGCVLRVKWVESEAIKKWVESHALRTPQTAEFANDGTYDEGIYYYGSTLANRLNVFCANVFTLTKFPMVYITLLVL